MIIREEKTSDIKAITDVTIVAFRDHPFGGGTEQFIIMALRKAGALSLSLVAEEDGVLIGHGAFSPVEISDGAKNWYGVGPISVMPERQRQGIGSAIMREGIAILRNRGAQGFALVGFPEYYQRFGFRNYPELTHEGVPPEVFLCLPLSGSVPSGEVVFHPGFHATEPPEDD